MTRNSREMKAASPLTLLHYVLYLSDVSLHRRRILGVLDPLPLGNDRYHLRTGAG